MHPLLLPRHAEPDPDDVGPARAQLRHHGVGFRWGQIAERRCDLSDDDRARREPVDRGSQPVEGR